MNCDRIIMHGLWHSYAEEKDGHFLSCCISSKNVVFK